MALSIRDARPADAVGILPIYNYAVNETTAVWTEDPSDVAGRVDWLADRVRRGWPVLVGEVDGRVVGFASFGDFRIWPGYRNTVENSVYVAPASHGQGVGRALMTELVGRARAARKHVMVAGIEAGNAASIALHARLGFEKVGQLPQVGTKFGRWLDLVLMQIVLDGRLPPD